MRFIWCFFLTLTLWVTVVVTLNYKMDPAGLFAHHGHEKEIAQALVEGKNILIKVNRNPRLITKLRIENDTARPQIVVLGSSRSMSISSNLLHGPLVNCSIPSGCFEDLVTFGVMAKDKFHPTEILICPDPWIFNAHGFHGIHMDKSFIGDYLKAGGKIGLHPTQINAAASSPYLQLLNLSYTMDSCKALLKSNLSQPNFRITNASESQEFYDLIRADGSRMEHQSLLHRSREDVAASSCVNMIFPCSSYTYSEEGATAFKLLINYLKPDCNLEIVLLPLNPVCYLYLSKNYPVKETENQLRSMAQNAGVNIYGSFDPSVSGCVMDDFYDPIHCKESGIIKILSLLPSGR